MEHIRLPNNRKAPSESKRFPGELLFYFHAVAGSYSLYSSWQSKGSDSTCFCWGWAASTQPRER